MKIKSLHFYDYRAFYADSLSDKKEYLIEVDSKNLLIYGENGSGKTSLFNGLKDIVNQKDYTSHLKTPILNDGFVEITFNDLTSDKFDATGYKASKPELIKIAKLNSFLSYKELLRTHLHNEPEVNFFGIFVNDILKEHSLQTLGQLKSAWDNLTSINLIQAEVAIDASFGKMEISAEEAKEQKDKLKIDLEDKITIFNDEFDVLLETINLEIKEVLDYFKQGIDIKFELRKLSLANLGTSEIVAHVNYAKLGLNSFHKILNEAKLSAIALSIYLTALRSNPTKGSIRLLFFDDIFLGLDLNNRLPFLDILKDKFSEWQIFLTTYDFHWFEVAKQHLNSNWLALEMYTSTVDGESFEKPIIINSENYLSKAEKYYKAGDYPASLNFLRKELEFKIKERLPEETVRHFDTKPHALSHLWELLIERYERNNHGHLISAEVREEVNLIRSCLLNPQSHDNLSTPVYKYELQRAFKLIREIEKIPIIKGIVLLSKGMDLVFKHPKVNYSISMELLDDWLLDIVAGIKNHVYPKCSLKYWQLNDNEYFNLHTNLPGTKPDKPIIERFDIVRRNLIGYRQLQPITEKIFNSNTIFENIWSIQELIDKCDDQKRDNLFCRIFRR